LPRYAAEIMPTISVSSATAPNVSLACRFMPLLGNRE
jgi:hypothetical protein